MDSDSGRVGSPPPDGDPAPSLRMSLAAERSGAHPAVFLEIPSVSQSAEAVSTRDRRIFSKAEVRGQSRFGTPRGEL